MTARKDTPADSVVWIIRDSTGVTWECFIAANTRTKHRNADHYAARINALEQSNTPYYIVPGTADPAAHGYEIGPDATWFGTSWPYENQDGIPAEKQGRDTPGRAVQAGNGQIYHPEHGLAALARKLDEQAAVLAKLAGSGN